MTTEATTLPAACTPLTSGYRAPIALFTPSTHNARTIWSAKRVSDMAASMRKNGQLQPIRVRRNPLATADNGRPPFEIVMGETRWRAAPEADIGQLDFVLGEYTDQEVLELSIIENTQRKDLHPLEEAVAFEHLLRKENGLQGYATVPDLAARFGVSPSYVYQRLKLTALCKAAREAFLEDKISASVALLIARMPDQAEQATATARILQGFGGEPYSFRAAAEYLQREFMLSLSLATFDTAASYSMAGPCSQCTKRSGASPDLFADVPAGDMCQDSRCYQAKVAEAHTLLLQAARDEGHAVLTGKDATKVLATPNATPVGHYRLTEACPGLTHSNKPLGQLLPTSTPLVLVEHPSAQGTVVQLVTHAMARSGLKQRGFLRTDLAEKGSSSKQVSPSTKAESHAPDPAAPPSAGKPTKRGVGETQAKPTTKEQERQEVEALRATHEATLLKFGELLFAELREKLIDAEHSPLIVLRMAVNWLWAEVDFEATALLYKQRGWERDENGAYGNDFARRLEAASGQDLALLLAEMLVVEELTDPPVIEAEMLDPHLTRSANAMKLAEHFDIDLQRVLRDARAVLAVGEKRSAAGSASREQSPTEAFIEQHATGAQEAAVAGVDQQKDEGQ